MTELLPADARLCRRELPDPVAEPTIKATRAAAILDLSPRAILYACERGEIPCIRVGRAVRIPTARFLAQFGLADQPPAPAARPALAVVRGPGEVA